MCGIGGKVSFTSEEVSLKDLEKISTAISHRGPDDKGVFLSENKKVGLVHHRLAIIDLSNGGHQPMVYKKRYWVTFNGEIYNYKKIQSNLIKKGYKFKSKSDTEVILALYDLYKERCVEYLRGMFALAIWDDKEKVLFLTRDRVGKKPLKFYIDSNVFIFASELKALLTQKEVKKVPDWDAIHNYLTYGYVPAPQTGFEGIYKLEPGCFIKVNASNGKIEQWRYWEPDFSKTWDLTEKEWVKLILKNLEEATKLRMISDVPLGAFLSGGVDSSAVVASMARLSSRPVKTFTITFKEKAYNESEHAIRMAKLYRTDHTELLVEPKSAELLPELVSHFEEPFSDSSSVITYMVSQLARKHVKVILNGDGGDELFTGYLRHLKLSRDNMTFNNRGALNLLKAIPAKKVLPRAYKYLDKLEILPEDNYLEYQWIFSNEDKKNLYGSKIPIETRLKDSLDIYKESYRKFDQMDRRNKVLYADINYYLPDDLLTKVDMASMKVALECRSPLLDHKMIELAAKIPFNLKIKNGETKYIFKRALEKIVPKENLYRKKMGFSVPLVSWFSGDLNKYAKSKLLNGKLVKEGRINKAYVSSMLTGHSGKNDFGPKLWNLLVLEMWYDHYFG